jgi:peptidase E
MNRRTQSQNLVVLGGGGFMMEPDNPLLDDFTLSWTGRSRPRVCFLPTASGDSEVNISNFHRAFPASRAEASHVSLFRRDAQNVSEHLLSQHVIYVGGGNTANMLAVWRVHGVDEILRQAYAQGIVLTGVSAGMICWFEGGVTDSFGPLAPLRDGLKLLAGSACPHYDGEANRRPAYQAMVAASLLPPGIALDDGAGAHFVNGELREIVTSRPGVCGYAVSHRNGVAVESPLPARYLGTG